LKFEAPTPHTHHPFEQINQLLIHRFMNHEMYGLERHTRPASASQYHQEADKSKRASPTPFSISTLPDYQVAHLLSDNMVAFTF
jgi:hypothetical protein